MTTSQKKTVTVIGLGLMGSALARAFLAGGYELTVWNRTATKAEPFEGYARVADSVRAACDASGVIVVSLLDYEASDTLLRNPEVEAVIPGKLLIQLTTGTPTGARNAEKWARASGADYLDGAIMAYPREVGDEGTRILFSGSRSTFDQNLELLEVLGGKPVFCGEEIGSAAALDHASLEVGFGRLALLFHAMAICAAESVPFESLFDLVRDSYSEDFVDWATAGVETGTYESGNSTMVTNASWARQLIQVSQDAHVDTSIPEALLSCMTRTIGLGYGADDMQSMYEAVKPRSSHAELVADS
jgi:3-hydroxyisobutyrate dehydrogenase-like beta-hydroxyacid dehydrogenase